jgi:hypothetical protein
VIGDLDPPVTNDGHACYESRTQTHLIVPPRARLVRKACFEEIKQLKRDTIFASIPAPHLVLQREPQRAADLIERFLESLPD